MPVRDGQTGIKQKIFVPNTNATAWREVAFGYYSPDNENWVKFYSNEPPVNFASLVVENGELVVTFEVGTVLGGNPNNGVNVTGTLDGEWTDNTDPFSASLGTGIITDNVITYPISNLYAEDILYFNYAKDLGSLTINGQPMPNLISVPILNRSNVHWNPNILSTAIAWVRFDDKTKMFKTMFGKNPVQQDTYYAGWVQNNKPGFTNGFQLQASGIFREGINEDVDGSTGGLRLRPFATTGGSQSDYTTFTGYQPKWYAIKCTSVGNGVGFSGLAISGPSTVFEEMGVTENGSVPDTVEHFIREDSPYTNPPVSVFGLTQKRFIHRYDAAESAFFRNGEKFPSIPSNGTISQDKSAFLAGWLSGTGEVVNAQFLAVGLGAITDLQAQRLDRYMAKMPPLLLSVNLDFTGKKLIFNFSRNITGDVTLGWDITLGGDAVDMSSATIVNDKTIEVNLPHAYKHTALGNVYYNSVDADIESVDGGSLADLFMSITNKSLVGWKPNVLSGFLDYGRYDNYQTVFTDILQTDSATDVDDPANNWRGVNNNISVFDLSGSYDIVRKATGIRFQEQGANMRYVNYPTDFNNLINPIRSFAFKERRETANVTRRHGMIKTSTGDISTGIKNNDVYVGGQVTDDDRVYATTNNVIFNNQPLESNSIITRKASPSDSYAYVNGERKLIETFTTTGQGEFRIGLSDDTYVGYTDVVMWLATAGELTETDAERINFLMETMVPLIFNCVVDNDGSVIIQFDSYISGTMSNDLTLYVDNVSVSIATLTIENNKQIRVVPTTPIVAGQAVKFDFTNESSNLVGKEGYQLLALHQETINNPLV